MGSLGVHFALTSTQAEALVGAGDPDELMALVEEIEEGAGEDYLVSYLTAIL